MTTRFSKRTLLEADGLLLIDWPDGQREKVALVMENFEQNIKVYFFLDRETIAGIVDDLVTAYGRSS